MQHRSQRGSEHCTDVRSAIGSTYCMSLQLDSNLEEQSISIQLPCFPGNIYNVNHRLEIKGGITWNPRSEKGQKEKSMCTNMHTLEYSSWPRSACGPPGCQAAHFELFNHWPLFPDPCDAPAGLLRKSCSLSAKTPPPPTPLTVICKS